MTFLLRYVMISYVKGEIMTKNEVLARVKNGLTEKLEIFISKSNLLGVFSASVLC
ncbi:hypothetical protein GO684_04805 [Wolbachia endosymbiont of Litomosoides brasiliensis]|uniref:hypothetical protein n=1 Tax=Wolbachia endosymbiont of Litomosoides brasiliensis TaxID=1812117 RepID=UPI00158D7E7D|nr:hypothetical protein [Wolbachia endosymbiont of Litomosoides brasiliensis]NUY39913.1 hypothetical protein [Wolbachia endosymbiont of Litomosoides brasiliensis]